MQLVLDFHKAFLFLPAMSLRYMVQKPSSDIRLPKGKKSFALIPFTSDCLYTDIITLNFTHFPVNFIFLNNIYKLLFLSIFFFVICLFSIWMIRINFSQTFPLTNTHTHINTHMLTCAYTGTYMHAHMQAWVHLLFLSSQ